MKNKNSFYIVLGFGLGVVAYFIFCKNKTKKTAEIIEEEPIKEVVETGFTPKYVTPIATTTPLIVNITTNKPKTPTEVKPVISSSPSPAPTPIPTPTTVLKPQPISTIVTETKPTLVKTDLAQVSRQLTDIKPSFEGVGQQCFEVGECLYDL